LHIGEAVAKIAEKNNFRKPGILGTKFLMEGSVYPEILKQKNISFSIPPKEQRVIINDIIFKELVYGIIKERSKRIFLNIINELRSEGCDSIVLGCTEIPLIVLPEDSSLPVLDSTRILARAALSYSVENNPD
jgi:aspartate racemase